MTPTAFSIARQLLFLPANGLLEVAALVAPVFHKYAPTVHVSEVDASELRLSDTEAARGDFATDAEVAQAFSRVHASLGV